MSDKYVSWILYLGQAKDRALEIPNIDQHGKFLDLQYVVVEFNELVEAIY